MTDRLDDAIDRAAREMLDVEPAADLRARVVRQIVAKRGSRSAPPLRWIVMPVAGVALILLAVIVARRSGPVMPPQTIVARGADTALPAPIAAAPKGRPVAQAPASSPAALGARPVVRTAATVAAAAYARESDAGPIAPLNRIAPITIAPIAQDSILPEAMEMRALDPISDVQIAPLTPPDRRN